MSSGAHQALMSPELKIHSQPLTTRKHSEILRPLTKPTESTRIFELLPGSVDSIISLRLHHTDLAQPRKYQCISYTWGEDPATVEILLNGHRYAIRRNLWNFIHRLRHIDESRYLWADAICINQDDLIEKGHQVSVIGRIFSLAVDTLVWLGKGDDDSERVMKAATTGWLSERDAPHYHKNQVIPFWGGHTGRKCHCHCPSETCARQTQEEDVEGLFKAWKSFLMRPYWYRTWIIQEIVLSKNLAMHCGDLVSSWDQLQRLAEEMFEFECAGGYLPADGGDTLEVVYNHLCALSSVRKRKVWGFPSRPWLRTRYPHRAHLDDESERQAANDIPAVISLSCDTHCSDPRDKVYSLLPLERNGSHRAHLQPDYTISCVELYFKMLKTYPDVTRDGVDMVRRALELEYGDILEEVERHPELSEVPGCWYHLMKDDLESRGKKVPTSIQHPPKHRNSKRYHGEQ